MTVSQSADSSNGILGTWKLDYCYQENGNERVPIVPDLKGHIILLKDRMFCFTTRDSPDGVPDGLLLVYTGPYEVSEDFFITTVEFTSIQGYLGSKQKRFFKVDGDTLDIRPAAPDGSPLNRHLIWQRQ